MRQADVALYRAKSSGRTFAIRSYDSQMDAALRTQTQMEDALRDAISRGAMTVAFQPIVELASARVEGFEALGRWTDPALGDVPPATFVTVAESIQLARDLVLHQLNLACGVARHWPSHVRLAINLSPVQLNDSQLGQEIVLTLEAWSIETSRLEIEITETAVLQDTPASRVTIETLREAGARIVLDDFGTGYSSLHHVRRLRPHVIKIDRTFVAGLLVEPESRAIISAVAALGRGLGISITAEGIENRKQAEVLMGLGCECGQGFLYGWPMKGDATHRYFQPSREAHAAVAAGAARRADRSVG
jgi:predicted signal transduction protein with EAL and GGDEF domain